MLLHIHNHFALKHPLEHPLLSPNKTMTTTIIKTDGKGAEAKKRNIQNVSFSSRNINSKEEGIWHDNSFYLLFCKQRSLWLSPWDSGKGNCKKCRRTTGNESNLQKRKHHYMLLVAKIQNKMHIHLKQTGFLPCVRVTWQCISLVCHPPLNELHLEEFD